MKKLLFGIATIALVSCGKEETVNYALFKGNIKNPNGKELKITNSSNELVRTIKVLDDGSFTDTIFNANGHHRFSDGKESSSFYLKDGYDLSLNMDTKEFDETIVYTGKGNEVNNFLAQKYLIKERAGSPPELYGLEESAYVDKMNNLNKELEKALEKVDSDFAEEEKIKIKYEQLTHMMKYQDAYRYFSKNKDFTVSEAFPIDLEKIDVTNEEHFEKYDAYKEIVRYHLSKTASKNAKKENISFEAAAITYLKNQKSDVIKNDILKGLAFQVSISNPNSEVLYNGIMELSNDEEFKEKLTKQYTSMQKLADGKVSPSFENYENNAGGTTSLADLKGKYVYIDLWATWCQPCKAEIPFLKKVEEKYSGKNIAFVSISIDAKADHDTWKKMVKDEELGGIQLMADKDWQSKFVLDYQVQGIPHFILIDPEGNIVKSYAPRPSNKKLIELFDELKI
ncbi:TlpA family protein disulfide reductase [Tenacibaculum jejuense]|uniref:Thioredoxin family lipoprotein n=1 Tax=Tenacibaculum jejuense TaxID=584609 RepID=A0A238UEW3_9FLAO|nr:TlpA disulfide reductase family protein [Tenacibaculum jejuense]SNR17536.1 Thioredoxin family lipoprotein precursor [Tenacibaculum jejuense]